MLKHVNEPLNNGYFTVNHENHKKETKKIHISGTENNVFIGEVEVTKHVLYTFIHIVL